MLIFKQLQYKIAFFCRACIHTRVYAKVLHNIEIWLYLAQKRAYFAFKISLCRFTYLDSKIG